MLVVNHLLIYLFPLPAICYRFYSLHLSPEALYIIFPIVCCYLNFAGNKEENEDRDVPDNPQSHHSCCQKVVKSTFIFTMLKIKP